MTNKLSIATYFNVLRNSAVAKGTSIIAIGVFISSVLNYFLQIFLGRVLSIEQFGLFNSLLSLTYVLTVPGNAIAMSIIKQVTEIKSKKNFSVLTNLYWGITLSTVAVGLTIFLILVVFKSKLVSYMNISTPEVLVPYALFVGLTYLNTAPKSYLQGLLRFKGFAFYSVTTALVRLSLPLLFVYAGYRAGGAFVGISLAMIFAYLTGTMLLTKNFEPANNLNVTNYYSKILKFSAPILIIQVSMTILSNIDLVLVKHFFDETSTGIYSSVVTIGKVLLFGTGIITTTMFPIMSDAYTSKKDFNKKFISFLIIFIGAIGCGLLVFTIFPEFITRKMFGNRYLPATYLLPKFVLFISLYSFTNFLVLFSLAIEKVKIYRIIIMAVISQITLLHFFHQSLSAIITVNIYVILSLLVSISLYLFYTYKSDDTKSINNITSI